MHHLGQALPLSGHANVTVVAVLRVHVDIKASKAGGVSSANLTSSLVAMQLRTNVLPKASALGLRQQLCEAMRQLMHCQYIWPWSVQLLRG